MIRKIVVKLLFVITAVSAVEKFPIDCEDKNQGKDDTTCSIPQPNSAGIGMETLTIPATHVMNSQRNPDHDSFFVVTTIFNPASYQRRYTLYHNFAQHMKDTGAELITIECIFPTLNQTEFQVTQPNNPFHIQIKSESVYFMKENLINIAVSRLPSHAKWVAWLDADMSFHENNWIDLTIQALDKYSVVQVYQKLNNLGPEGEVMNARLSLGYCVRSRDLKCPKGGKRGFSPPGLAWATSVPTFKLINGLPETSIIGMGDAHFAFPLINQISRARTWTRHLHPEYKKLIEREAKDTFNKLSAIPKPILGYVPVTVTHYWHGSKTDRTRRNFRAWEMIRTHDFNFVKDVKKTPEGLLVLAHKEIMLENGTRRTLRDDLINYFRQRNDDGTEQRN